ncbi:MAG: molecular chaperone HtpG [Alphaproteobacteria bacterium]
MSKATTAKAGSEQGDETAAERMPFQAEVSRLLDIVANALYSEREIFLRELISNASDACDRLRYAAVTAPDLVGSDSEYRIDLTPDPDAGTLTVADNGIGMTREDMVGNLGTIARSGTAAFVEQLKASAKSGEGSATANLIGQFGVGFYSAFMVADSVEVVSRRAGEEQAWRWVSDGRGDFTVAPAERSGRGTSIVLKLKPDAREFLEPMRLRRIVKTYSDHIPFPIRLVPAAAEGEAERLNEAAALWTRSRSEVTEQQYKEFYHHVAHAADDPWLTLHFRTEGVIAYSGLLFVPGSQPFDLFHPDRKPGVKLYVRRVFITDDCAALVPSWLRFLRGVVDSEDLSLNVSREMLQHDPVLAKIKSGLTKRVLGELARKAEKEPDSYLRFWEHFGAVLKEGLYEAFEHRDELLKLARFRSTHDDGLVSLADYVGRMREGQTAIYTIGGDDLDLLRKSPQLEGFRARGIEVLLLTDPVDEFWVPSVGIYDGKPFRSVTRGGADLSAIADADKTDKPAEKAPEPEGTGDLIAVLKTALGDAVKDVRTTERLTDSPVCLIADEGDLDMRLARMLKQHRQLDHADQRILELNPGHPLIRALAARALESDAADALADAAHLLLDQARIVEGEPLPDPAGFAKRLAGMMERGL